MARSRKNIGRWLVLVCLTMHLMSSCVLKKMLTQEADTENFSESSYLQRVISNAPVFNEFSAKMRLTLSQGKENISVGGSLKMKKDEVIQLSIVAIGIVEAARIELTPHRLLVLDRMGRRYVEVKYDDLPFLRQSKLDFYTLQSLFWNELFLPGVKHVGKEDLHHYKVTSGDEHVTLTTDEGKRLSYSFFTALTNGWLEETRIHANVTKENNYQMNWRYADFLTIDGQQFPTTMNLLLQGADKPLEATFTFSRCETQMEYSPLSVPNRYKQVEVADILKNLLTQ